MRLALALCAAFTFATLSAAPQQAPELAKASNPTRLSDAEIERFLISARVVKTRSAGKGITGSLRATMTDGTFTHDAHIQTIDETKREFKGSQGTELNFRDSWTFNVAAYRISRMLGFELVPVSVPRKWKINDAAYTWWVDDVKMHEEDRLKNKIQPPDPASWNEQMQLVRLFDQLIANIDRNLGNLVITSDWTLWAIDHTRAFRMQPTLKAPGNVARCDRAMFDRLKKLEKESLKREVGRYLQSWDIDAMLKRRDAIVAIIDSRGDAGLFDLRPTTHP